MSIDYKQYLNISKMKIVKSPIGLEQSNKFCNVDGKQDF